MVTKLMDVSQGLSCIEKSYLYSSKMYKSTTTMNSKKMHLARVMRRNAFAVKHATGLWFSIWWLKISLGEGAFFNLMNSS